MHLRSRRAQHDELELGFFFYFSVLPSPLMLVAALYRCWCAVLRLGPWAWITFPSSAGEHVLHMTQLTIDFSVLMSLKSTVTPTA
jgi:hypothetical protein